MKTNYEILDDTMLDAEDLAAERDLQLAAVDSIRRARQFGITWVTREDGKIKEIPPEQTAPYENRLLASAEKLNQRIQFLKQSEASNYSLNDQPPLQ
ncbi:MAG: hypothetical protein M9920_00730 [Verrucomicrobiae bacterium]|nr:hypothetical protein [Verrucomicrobiae bacterium]